MSRASRQEIITFKVDEELAKAMDGVPNRSEFIRRAILAALDNICPLCKGTGTLTMDQQRHWESFSRNHSVALCANCSAVHLVCAAGESRCRHEGAEGA
jgi:hypothetical protein